MEELNEKFKNLENVVHSKFVLRLNQIEKDLVNGF
jgi:hypothetical protein